MPPKCCAWGRGVTGGQSSPGTEWLQGEPKSLNNVPSTFFSTVHLPPNYLGFEHGSAKLAPCPGRHLTSLRPCLGGRYTPSYANVVIAPLSCENGHHDHPTILFLLHASSRVRCFKTVNYLLITCIERAACGSTKHRDHLDSFPEVWQWKVERQVHLEPFPPFLTTSNRSIFWNCFLFK